MYCSTCGSAVSPNLTYCNHCGTKLNGAKGNGVTKSSDTKPEFIVAMMAAVFVFGLGAIIGLIMALKMVFPERDNIGLIIFFTLLSFLIMLGVEGVFIWMLLRRRKGYKEANDTERFKKQTAKDLAEAKAHVLPEPAFGVTEHTTRNLETIDRETR